MNRILVVAISLSMLAACSSGADENNDGKVSAVEMGREMASGGAIKMKPGLWETKITFNSVDAKGLPDAAKASMLAAMGKGVSVKSCLTKEQVEKPGADFFGSPQESNCSFEELDRSGNRMKVAMTCKPDGKTVIQNSMDGSFATEIYSMNMKQKTSGTPMGDISMVGKIEGKRLGECPAS